mgnify:CR=1 FL=1
MLRQLVEYIYKSLSTRREIVAELLCKELAKTGFETKRISINTLLWQVAYGIVLKLILYGLIERRFNLSSLSEITADELRNAFKEAYETSGLQALKPSWIDISLSLVRITELKDLLQRAVRTIETQPTSDALGQLYEEIMPQEERRRLGEFYTPKPIAEFMVRWAVKEPYYSVLDPGVGSGTFLIEAFYRLEALGCDIRKAFSQLYGVDINPLATLMATINILRHVPDIQPRIFLADFLKLNPLTAPAVGFDRTTFEAIVCNPPYTRHHELLRPYKEEIARIIEAEVGEPVSRLSSIYLHFFIHACHFLKEEGRLAFITPSEWMESEYGVVLRRFLAKRMRVEAIVLFGEEALAFPGVLTRACITLALKDEIDKRTLLVRLRSWPPVSELIEAIERGEGRDYGWGRIKLCDLASIDPTTKWTPLFEELTVRTMSPFMTELAKLAKVSRGIATGANKFFVLSKLEVKRYGIEREYLRPVVAGARYIRGYDFTKADWELLRNERKKVYLLWCHKRKEELCDTSVIKYIERGERAGLDKRYLTRCRPVWYWVERRDVPDAFLVYMFRGGLRFIYNRAGAYALNTLHCVYFNKEIRNEEENVKAILAYLNSRPAFELARGVLRVYGGGMYKLEPKEAEKIPCIDPRAIPTAQRESLAALFDELCLVAKMDNASEEKVRTILDSEVRRLLSST